MTTPWIICPRFSCPTSWARTPRISEVFICATRVSKSAMRLVAPKPVKNALLCEERFEPSIS